MKTSEPADLTELLRHWRQGDEDAASQLLGVVYRDLRRIAGKYMRGERPSHTLQATALVHEAWMRLSRSPNAPGRQPRAVLPRHGCLHAPPSRRSCATPSGREAGCRHAGGRHQRLGSAARHPGLRIGRSPRGGADTPRRSPGRAQCLPPESAKVLELRFFGNKSIDEAAEALSVASGTVKRDFAFARSFLLSRMPVAGPSRSPR